MGLHRRRLLRLDLRRVPAADAPEDEDRQERDRREPGDAALPERHDDQRRQHRPHRGAEAAAELEHRLREAVAAAGGEPRDARRFRVKHRRAETNEGRRNEDDEILLGDAEQQQTEEGRGHADRQRIGLRLLVGVVTDHRLQQRGRELKGQRDHADLREVERVGVLQDRIHRGDQRLHGVVEEVRDADAGEHDIGRARGGGGRHVVDDDGLGQRFIGDDDWLVHCSIPARQIAATSQVRCWRRANHRQSQMAGMRVLPLHESGIVGWAKRSVPTLCCRIGEVVGTAQGRLCPP